MEEVHYSGLHANVLPTDTTKNTVYAFAKEHGIESAEQFGIPWPALRDEPGSHQDGAHPHREYAWERIETSDANSKSSAADEAKHSFVRKGQETRVTQITTTVVVGGHLPGEDLVVMNSTNSESGATSRTSTRRSRGRTTASWHPGLRPLALQLVRRRAEDAQLGEVLRRSGSTCSRPSAETYSLSLQQTLPTKWARGSSTTAARSTRSRFSLRTSTHFLVDLKPFGLEERQRGLLAADRPYGLIEATVLRDGVEPRIPVDLTNL